MKSQTLAILVIIVLLVAFYTLSSASPTVVHQGVPEPLPKVGSPASFMASHKNNTLEHRPGNEYFATVYANEREPPAYEIRLLYKPSCAKHHINSTFDYMAKQYTTDSTTAKSRISFVKEVVSEDAQGTFPKVIKIRRSGQVIEYNGYAGFGAFQDFVLDEGRLW